MPEAVIKVGDKKPPDLANNKKRWKVITPENTVYQLNSDIAPLFVIGKSYKIYFENHEFSGFKFKVIVRAPEEVPDISSGGSIIPTGSETFTRPRAAKEDEEGVNRRHRLNWIGERLDTFGAGKPTTYESLRPIVGILEELYDTISEGNKEAGFPKDTIRSQAQAHRANAYKPGQPASVDSDLDDDIPFN